MKIALGGTAANPAHYGHKRLVETIINLNCFDKIAWIVSGDRPDKPELLSAIDRWRMMKLLVTDDRVDVTYEEGVAMPTAGVIRKAQKDFPLADIVWYCGLDHFVAREEFDGRCNIEGFWHEGEWLMERQHFLIVKRKGLERSVIRYPKKYTVIDGDIPEISSTLIRQRLAKGLDNTPYTSQAVLNYIAQKQLYM
ncbi:MAG: nicotinate-nicotinamide nucleotide adenylyltransferase [Parcubacteria group bacterium]|jgi:nicotinate (nicotinamide) nucleotide adenylyltransferase